MFSVLWPFFPTAVHQTWFFQQTYLLVSKQQNHTISSQSLPFALELGGSNCGFSSVWQFHSQLHRRMTCLHTLVPVCHFCGPKDIWLQADLVMVGSECTVQFHPGWLPGMTDLHVQSVLFSSQWCVYVLPSCSCSTFYRLRVHVNVPIWHVHC